MLMNSLDPMLEECPEVLIVYGRTGKGVKRKGAKREAVPPPLQPASENR